VKSMTGFGRAEGTVNGLPVVVEVKSLNHRYKDVRLAFPKGWMALEVAAERAIQKRIGRGRIECAVRIHSGRGGARSMVLDEEKARQARDLYLDLAKILGTGEKPSLSLLAQTEGVIVSQDLLEDAQTASEDLERLLFSSLDALDGMRRAEGEKLRLDILKRVGLIREAVLDLEKKVPAEEAAIRERITKRLQMLAGQAGMSEDRLCQELAVIEERMDVSEELTRLGSHVSAFTAMASRTDSVGRELDFLLQEMNREATTLASKMHSAEVARRVVEVKAELEKIREQVQNVE
jgi:uncharacterized protein (TIGR00255 family)